MIVHPVYRITTNNSPGELFFRGGQKEGSYPGGGELIFRVGNFAKKLTFSVQVGNSHDDENGIGIWQQRITALEQVEITLWRPMCLERFQTTL